MQFLRDEYGTIRFDYILIAAVLLLALLGIVTLYSASYSFGTENQLRGNLIAYGVFAGSIVALILLKVFLFRDQMIKSRVFVMLCVLITIVFNIIPLVIKTSSGGNSRWIRVGSISFQPSEFIKVVLPLYLAYKLDKSKENINSPSKCIVPIIMLTGIFSILVLLQKNFSDAVLIAFFSLIICFVAGIKVGWFIAVLAVIIPMGTGLMMNNEIWKKRIDDFLTPLEELDRESEGYQIIHSLNALESGGFLGKGIGQGQARIKKFPEIHNDFIFASYAEENGFLGVVLYLTLVGVFTCIGLIVAWRSQEMFIQALAIGMVTPIALQTLINMAVVARIVPITGITLPFVSSGGTSLLTTLFSSTLLVYATKKAIKTGDMRELPYDG